MRYRYFYLKEEAKILGINLKPNVSYSLTNVNYDEVMSLCRQRKAVISRHKVTPNLTSVKAHTVRQKKEEKKKKEEKDEFEL